MTHHKISLTPFQSHLIARMVGCYGGTISGVLRHIVQSWIVEHADEIAARLVRFEEWKAKTPRSEQ